MNLHAPSRSAASDLFADGGEMGARMRALDWSATPLGPPEGWPQALRTVAGLAVAGREPMFVAWGPDLALIYNDAYAPLLGAKHPAAVGRPFAEVWSDIWEQFAPIVARVVAGESVWFQDLYIPMERHGYPEDTWFSLSYTPVRDEAGRVGGFFCACTETTAKVRGEAALRNSEEENRAIVEGAIDHAIFATDPQGVITSWSPGAEVTFGFSAEEAIGQGAEIVFTPEDRAAGVPRRELETAATEGCAADDRWHVRRDGSRVFVNGSARPLRSADGRITGFLKIARDETERRQVFEALAQSEARARALGEEQNRLAAILRQTPDFVGVADAAGQPIFVNEAGRRMVGLPDLEAVRRTSFADYHEPEEGRRLVEDVIPAVIRDGLWEGELTFRRFDNGRAVPVHGRLFAVRDELGELSGTAAILTDIAERKAAEDALRASEERFRTLVDAVPAFVWFADTEGRLNFYNARWYTFTGLSPEQSMGSGWVDVLHPDDVAATAAAWEEARARGMSYVVECRYRRLDGAYRWFLARAEPLRDEGGGIKGWFGTSFDVHDRKQAEDALRESEEHYRHAAELNPQVTWTARPDGQLDRVSQRWREWTGTSGLGETWAEGLHPDDRARTFEVWGRSADTGEPYDIEHRVKFLDGEHRWARSRALPRRDDSGAIVRWYGTTEDVHEQKTAQDALAVNERRFRELADNIPTLCWTADADGWIFWYNRRWYDYTGTSPEDQEGWGWESVHDPECLPAVAERWKRSLATGEPFEMTFPLKGVDGVFRPFLTRIVPIRDENGAVVRWFGTNTDVAELQQAEAALAESEQRFRDIADSIDQMIWSTRPDGFHDYFNRRWYEYTGVPEGSTDGEAWNGMFHPEDQDRAWATWRRCLETGEPYHIEYRLRDRTGQYRWVLGRALPVRDEAGRITRWYGTCTDIHEQKMVEARLSSIMDAVPVGILMAEAPSGKLVQSNRFMDTLLRRPVRMEEAAPDYASREAYDLEGRPVAEDEWPIRRVLATGEPAEAEVQFRRGDDTLGWLRIQAAPVRDSSGDTVGAVAGVTDLDEIMEAREVLARSRAELEQRAEQLAAERDRVWRLSEDLLAVARMDGTVVALNPAVERTLGWTEADLIGAEFLDFVHPDHRPHAEENLKALASGGAVRNSETLYRAKDGGYRWISWTVVASEGMMFGVGRDVTVAKAQAEQLERIEDQLRQAQKMEAVGQLTGGVAHDFNNLLQIVVGNLELLGRSLPEDAVRQRRSVENAMSGAKRAVTLTQRLLAFSRRQPLEPRPVSANKLVSGMSELLSRSLGETIQLETVLAAGLWQVEVDPNQLENTLLNLAVNARDAMPDGGKLTIETANTRLDESYVQQNVEVSPGQYVVICVSDTGTGMNKDVAARVFEPFFTTKEVGKGTGLGLSQVYGFVKQSGGHVKIYSEQGDRESRGTTVKIYLPRYLGEGEEESAAPDPDAPEGGPEETILVVEDDPDVRAYTVEVLGELGYRVLEAADAHAALRLLRDAAVHCDLLFTDVVLPGGMNGEQLAAAAHEARPGLKVLFTTGYARNAIVHQGRLDPGVRLITKPFTYADLAARVRDVLDEAPPT